MSNETATPPPASADTPEFDVVVWGATGFTGRLVAEYLLRQYGVHEKLRWALGGRNTAKLESVRREIFAQAPPTGSEGTTLDPGSLPLIVGDAADADFTKSLARRTRVVCTTVGPYAKYGSNLVAACASAGTDYCDLTGEVQWMRRMIDSHLEAAQESGARIVHTCGFDCIPSDLGVYFLQQQMRAQYGVSSPHVKLRVKGFSGAASGGTIASMLNMMEEAERDPEVPGIMRDPYSLNPKDQRFGPDQEDRLAPSYDAAFEQWIGPFVMAAVNTRVVRRSNALLDYAYGRDFHYDEAVLAGGGPLGFAKAAGTAAAMGGGMAAMAIGPVRRAVGGQLPAPGDGPTREQQEKGYFDLRLWAKHPSDPKKSLRARVTGDRDPGYGSTSKMLGESAVCLALDESQVGGGFWTPASAMGDALLTRLERNAGLTFGLE